ncbi:DNA/RNA non-specific endonuclease [Paenibacillus sp. GP183]|uniref:DNA/RNA non-specific endonuclease n=1 Tax=Paenibacillus sp. GP183 TaxID=1882751 RepID=UPI000899B7EA|nr:DNA/RNA non-specific endonuclease [Paenibacillus sp. GP183]SEB52893.1 endonuclease G [Paenibacillus sp. GP183]
MSKSHSDQLPQMNVDLITMQQQQALQRYMDRTDEREKIALELRSKSPLEVDTQERASFRQSIINPLDGMAFERIIGNNDLFPISYLEAGLRAGKAVCRIEVRDRIGRVLGHGTGFLVSPSLLLTNNHVLENEDAALFSLAQFNYELDLDLRERQAVNFRFEPGRFFMTDTKLDFTLVALEVQSTDRRPLSEFGFLPLLRPSGKALIGECVSIIQHPGGSPKAVTIRENKITDVVDDFIQYSADTMEGSSGSPVFNDEWILVALHHASVPDPKGSGQFISNEGIRISSIIEFVRGRQFGLTDDRKMLLDAMIKQWQIIENQTETMQVEELSIDSYNGLTGYDPAFLGETYTVPHPMFPTNKEQDLAPLSSGGTILHYTHFSIVMSKSRRLAYYTVVNIDGNQLIDVPRANDKWYFDPRIESRYQCGPELYSGNSLDRGHLVRRRDPDWGDKAEEANRNTFHFTNCSPQHAYLNQKTWLELENYILDHAQNDKLKVTVFTGPVFRTDDMVYRDVQIPAEFWKVVVMVKEDGKLSATAYLQTQKNLIDNLEFAYGAYKTYQVPITHIEELTSLKFGELRNHDPIDSLTVHVVEIARDIVV